MSKAATRTNLDWFMAHPHESKLAPDGGFVVRVWAHGAKQPPVEGSGRTWDDAVDAARALADRV